MSAKAKTLSGLSETARERMTPEARALAEDIAAGASAFGAPVDAVAILRKVRGKRRARKGKR